MLGNVGVRVQLGGRAVARDTAIKGYQHSAVVLERGSDAVFSHCKFKRCGLQGKG